MTLKQIKQPKIENRIDDLRDRIVILERSVFKLKEILTSLLDTKKDEQ